MPSRDGGEIGMRTAKLPSAFVVGATNLTVSAFTPFPVNHWQTCLSVLPLDACSCLAAARPDNFSSRPKSLSFNSPLLFRPQSLEKIARPRLKRERTKMEAAHSISARSMPSMSTQQHDTDSFPRPSSASLARKTSIRAVPYDPTDTRLPLAPSLSGASTGSYSPSSWPFPKGHQRQNSKSKLP